MQKITKFKIKSLGITDIQFVGFAFGRQIEYYRKIEDWKKDANSTHLSQKRQSWKKAISEFVKLNGVKEYFCSFHAGLEYFDDTFEFFWK